MKKPKQVIYHLCSRSGSAYSDGIVYGPPIESPEQLADLRRVICKEPGTDPDKTTILSLTRL